MDQVAIRELALTIGAVGSAVTVTLGVVGTVVFGVPRLVRSWERSIMARAERDEAVTEAVRLVPELNERVKRLEHEVAPNGDPMDEGRPMRQIVRYQGSQINVQTGLIQQINERLAASDQHFASHDRRLEHLEVAHEHREHPEGESR